MKSLVRVWVGIVGVTALVTSLQSFIDSSFLAERIYTLDKDAGNDPIHHNNKHHFSFSIVQHSISLYFLLTALINPHSPNSLLGFALNFFSDWPAGPVSLSFQLGSIRWLSSMQLFLVDTEDKILAISPSGSEVSYRNKVDR